MGRALMARALTLTLGDRTVAITIEPGGRVAADDQWFLVEPLGAGLYRVSHDARHWIVAVAGPPDGRWVSVGGRVAQVDVASATDRRAPRRSAGGDLTAPMPATVIRVSATPGDTVAAGTVLIVLEAMKMELAIRAPHDGVVGPIHCQPGQLVQPGVPLLEFV
jgi:biotin carboxyl carrier protein